MAHGSGAHRIDLSAILPPASERRGLLTVLVRCWSCDDNADSGEIVRLDSGRRVPLCAECVERVRRRDWLHGVGGRK